MWSVQLFVFFAHGVVCFLLVPADVFVQMIAMPLPSGDRLLSQGKIRHQHWRKQDDVKTYILIRTYFGSSVLTVYHFRGT